MLQPLFQQRPGGGGQGRPGRQISDRGQHSRPELLRGKRVGRHGAGGGLLSQLHPRQSQANTLLEVASGTSDAAIIDYLMAVASTGEGTSYENLTYTVSLADEQYGVGFRKGSDLAEKLNEFFAEKYADGTMQQVAEKYGIAEKLVEQL